MRRCQTAWLLGLNRGDLSYVDEGSQEHGEEYGRWVARFPDIGVWGRNYVNDEMHGRSVWWKLDCTIYKVEEYRHGELVP